MTKDPSKISNLLNFLSKMSEKIGDKRKREERNKIREIFGEMLGIGSKKKDQDKIFYLVKCPELDGKSLSPIQKRWNQSWHRSHWTQ